jgi:lysophospholipase L1-like esterase
VGRFDFSNPLAPKFAHSGSMIEFEFKGIWFDIKMHDISQEGPQNKNFFTVLKNGETIEVIEIDTFQRKYHININSPDSFVVVQIFKRTEARCGITVFKGISIENSFFKKTAPKERKIEWIGDSFMAGYGNLVSIQPPPKGNPSTGFHAENEDGYQAFGAITSRFFNADYSCIAVSGHGVYRNYDVGEEWTLPKIYPYLFPDVVNLKKFDFSYNPDLIVIKIGTNDFGAEIRKPPVMADSARFVSAYLEFLNFVTKKNPTSKIVLAVGGGISDVFPKGLNRLSRFITWVKNVKMEAEKKFSNQFGFFEFKLITPPYGEDWHPTKKDQYTFAEEITPFIKNFMKW